MLYSLSGGGHSLPPSMFPLLLKDGQLLPYLVSSLWMALLSLQWCKQAPHALLCRILVMVHNSRHFSPPFPPPNPHLFLLFFAWVWGRTAFPGWCRCAASSTVSNSPSSPVPRPFPVLDQRVFLWTLFRLLHVVCSIHVVEAGAYT